MTTVALVRNRLRLALMQSGGRRSGDDRITIYGIVCATAVALAVLGVVAYAIGTGHGTEALLGMAAAVIVAYLNSIHSKVAEVSAKSDQQTPPATPPEGS